MNIISAATRAVTKTADVTTAAAGAIGGAAVSGVVGAVQGAASGVKAGLDNGSKSPAAAALTIGAIGAAGLVEWPVLLAVGGTALVVRRVSQRDGDFSDSQPTLRSVPSTTENKADNSSGLKTTARKTTKSPARNRSRPAKKATAARRTTKK
ncbi:hypothetical protein ABQF33_11815 [Mycolicibacterium sp. XJ2]